MFTAHISWCPTKQDVASNSQDHWLWLKFEWAVCAVIMKNYMKIKQKLPQMQKRKKLALFLGVFDREFYVNAN